MLCKGLGTPDGSSAILGPSSGSSAATFSLNTSSVIGKRVSLMNIPNRDFIRGKRSKPIGPLTHGFPSHLDDPSKKMRSPASRQTFVNLAMHGSSMSVSTASISARFEMRGPHHRPICSRVARAQARFVRLCSFARRWSSADRVEYPRNEHTERLVALLNFSSKQRLGLLLLRTSCAS